ncbi:MAG: hypothetical protein LBJ69_01525 [Holosporales bacterium]|jgi:hypothetical protein|nr:hypothetical protein [Holosporales bacterium]
MKSKLVTSTLILGLMACEAWSSRERESPVVERAGGDDPVEEVAVPPRVSTVFTRLEDLQAKADEIQSELQALRQSFDGQSPIEIPSSITTEDIEPLLEPITEALTDEERGLPKILEHAGNAARDSGEALTAIGTMSDPSGQNTVFGRIAGVQATVDDGATGLAKIHARANAAATDAELAREELVHDTHGLAKIKGAIGSEGDAAATLDNTGSLHAKVRRLQDVIGTPDPLTGIHLWLNNALGLMIAQSRADEMLDRNGTPEPWRARFRQAMTHQYSDLRPDRDQTGPRLRWVEMGALTIGGPYTYVVMRSISHGGEIAWNSATIVDGGETKYWYEHTYERSSLDDIAYTELTLTVDYWDLPQTMTCTRLSGEWVKVPGEGNHSYTLSNSTNTSLKAKLALNRTEGDDAVVATTTTTNGEGQTAETPTAIIWHRIMGYRAE